MLTEAGGIRQRAVDCYSHLYNSEYAEDEGAFNSFCSGLPRVPEETNKELTEEEVYAALHAGGEGPWDRWASTRVFQSFLE